MTGVQLKAWRETTGYSQEDAAKRFFGSSRAALQNWEASPTVPYPVEAACKVWGRRVRQERAGHTSGPVIVVYSDGSFFSSPYGPQQRGSRIFQETYPFNSHAIARVCELADGSGIHNAFVIDGAGNALWETPELARVIDGSDKGAPTRRNLLRRCAEAITALANSARENPAVIGFGGEPVDEEKQARLQRIGELAGELDALAAATPSGSVTYPDVEKLTAEMRKVGRHPHSSVVSKVAQAFIELATLNDWKPSPTSA